MTHVNKAAFLAILAFTTLTFADPLIFTGHGETGGPPFPTSATALQVRSEAGTPLQALYISIASASPGSGTGLIVSSGASVAHIDTSKLEIYDYPGSYAQRFDGVNPGGDHSPSFVLSQNFNSTAFEALVQVDLPPDSPEEHLYYGLRGRIAPDQPITFSNVSIISSPQGYFDVNVSFLSTDVLLEGPVIQVDLFGSTTPIPEPSMVFIAALFAVPGRIRYDRRRHG